MMPLNLPISLIQQRDSKFPIIGIFAFLALSIATQVAGQDRWFQIEAAIFTNESRFERDAETWDASEPKLDFPKKIRRLERIQNSLLIEAFLNSADDSEADTALPDERSLRGQRILSVGPEPKARMDEFKLFDIQRDEYLDLPASLSDFSQTKRVLEQSSDHQLLFHGHWRQRVVDYNEATSIYIRGSQRIGSNQDLIGYLTIRFNDQQDRVVVDANLWLIEATKTSGSRDEWMLSELQDTLLEPTDALDQTARQFNGMFRVYPMQQSREMRSNEFHYLDHPALGLIIAVRPYNRPVD